MFVFEALFRLASLTLWAFFPIVWRNLVSADMDVLARKELANFRQYILHELKGLVLASAVHPGKISPVGAIGATKATEFGIRCKRGTGVTWHFDFGDNRDVTRLSIRDKFPNVALAIVAAVPPIGSVRGACLGIKSKANALSPCAYFR